MMKKINFLIVASMVLGTTTASADDYKDTSGFESKQISVGESFSSIFASKMVDVIVYRVYNPKDAKVVLYAEDGDFDNFEYTTTSNRLEIGYTREYLDSKNNKSFSFFDLIDDESDKFVKVYTTDLNKLDAKSMGDIIVEDSFSVDGLNIEVSSMGDVELKKKIDVMGDLYFNASSQSDIEAEEIIVDGSARIDVNSMGDVNINYLNVGDKLYIESNSMGDFDSEEVCSSGDYIKLHVTSMGDIDINELITSDKNVRLVVEGTSMGDIVYNHKQK